MTGPGRPRTRARPGLAEAQGRGLELELEQELERWSGAEPSGGKQSALVPSLHLNAGEKNSGVRCMHHVGARTRATDFLVEGMTSVGAFPGRFAPNRLLRSKHTPKVVRN